MCFQKSGAVCKYITQNPFSQTQRRKFIPAKEKRMINTIWRISSLVGKIFCIKLSFGGQIGGILGFHKYFISSSHDKESFVFYIIKCFTLGSVKSDND